MRQLLFLLCLLPAFAAGESKGPRTCRILFLGAPADAPEKLQLFDGKSCQEVELPQMNLSPVYRLPGGPLAIRMLATPPAKPEEVNPAAPGATLAEAVMDFYLLVSSDPTNKVVPIKLQVIDVNAANFKQGEMLWFNLTASSVGGQLGSQQLAMAPNSKAIVKAPAAKNEDYNVNLSYRMPDNDKLYPLCETKWLYDTRSRSLFFIISQEGSRTPRVLGFPDYRDAPEKSDKP
jgi:hypothetical protein